ncbi:recombinase family protein [Kocuria rosea]|nr:recombinase family protein [Kocuria rosea]
MLHLGGGDVDTATPTGSAVLTVMAALAALAQRELESTRVRITNSVARRQAAGRGLGGRPSVVGRMPRVPSVSSSCAVTTCRVKGGEQALFRQGVVRSAAAP